MWLLQACCKRARGPGSKWVTQRVRGWEELMPECELWLTKGESTPQSRWRSGHSTCPPPPRVKLPEQWLRERWERKRSGCSSCPGRERAKEGMDGWVAYITPESASISLYNRQHIMGEGCYMHNNLPGTSILSPWVTGCYTVCSLVCS